jgi:SAM-dependent methyltransferase
MLKSLKNKSQIADARQQLKSRGQSFVESAPQRLLRGLKLLKRPPLGDYKKSWDLLETIQLLDESIPRDAAILDIGAYCSELPVALAASGYTAVHGIDLNPDIHEMPMADRISYAVGDFLHTPYDDESFLAVTAISVIEHGYQPEALFKEVSRLLKPGGLFAASFDYWPEKIDTGSTRFFDMDWLIFSDDDVREMLDIAEREGLLPIASPDFGAGSRCISCAGFDYTFGWIGLKKQA